MDNQKKRVSVAGLREADPTTMMVLTQDILSSPLVRFDARTLCDLLALSELTEGVQPSLAKELDRFRAQMVRELQDLPDGPPLAAWASELEDVEGERVPQSLRNAVGELWPERKDAAAVALLSALSRKWDETEPETLALDKPWTPDAPEQAVPKRKKVAAKKKTKRKTRSTVDPRREEWIREDVLSRLINYGNTGLKEPIVVAGARHRSPWDDLTEAEVKAVLRKLGREGRVRTSVGRWMIMT